jgi:predicted DNA-binding transcriptional regulator YafY
MALGTSPTARSLLALEVIQDSPGITADRLANRLGVSERAARRYVGVLREAGVPIESVRGPYGGYRVGRGLRVPPLMFTTPEALGLMMAVLEGRRGAADAVDPVETALGKIVRVLPDPVATPAHAFREVSARRHESEIERPQPETIAVLIQCCASRQRAALRYLMGRERAMEVDPWAVVVRHGRWYLLCWSHTRNARRVLRVDRIRSVDVREDTFTPPADLDPAEAIEEHLSQGWRYDVDVVIDAPIAQATPWIRRSLGRLEAIDATHTRLVATTDEPHWYAEQLTAIHAHFHVVGSPELREATRFLGQRFLRASSQPHAGSR